MLCHFCISGYTQVVGVYRFKKKTFSVVVNSPFMYTKFLFPKAAALVTEGVVPAVFTKATLVKQPQI